MEEEEEEEEEEVVVDEDEDGDALADDSDLAILRRRGNSHRCKKQTIECSVNNQEASSASCEC